MLLAAYKPPFVSSNAFLSRLKRQLGIKKAGYLGTLDPFACGVMVLGFNGATRLFPHLVKSPKRYRATLWLGARSASLDIENIESITLLPPFERARIEEILSSLVGSIEYEPPRFSARHISGQRAYKLAREGREFHLPLARMEVFSTQLVGYNHPFVSFEVSVSEGGYVRSIGEMIAHSLGCDGALSSLERLSEGAMSVSALDSFSYNGFTLRGVRRLSALEHLPYPRLETLGRFAHEFACGKKIRLNHLQKGKYIACFEDFFSIIEVFSQGEIAYIANRIEQC